MNLVNHASVDIWRILADGVTAVLPTVAHPPPITWAPAAVGRAQVNSSVAHEQFVHYFLTCHQCWCRMVYNKVVDSSEDPKHYKVFEDTWSRKLANHGIPEADNKLIKEQWSSVATDYYIKDQQAEHTELCIIDGASPVLAIPQQQEDRLMDEVQKRFENKKVKGLKKEVDV